ncbi:agmatine deiminase family protein [Sphingomonas sp.]|uniref:agmatine deiminase family protein n=1 Tax=Sphingomonas sp. TaxID=28214 RepID=UPI0037526B20
MTIPLPEWALHEALWIGFPSDRSLWAEDLAPAQQEVVEFARAIHADGKGEAVWLVAADEAAATVARKLAPFSRVIHEPFGDVWLRDTGAIVTGSGRNRRAQGFVFNGWGGKYDLPGDDSIGERLSAEAGLAYAKADWILEGGAIDGDGSGSFITTEQCLLNPNRNPGLSYADIEQRLARDLGADRIVWLGQGLANDHTDGHVDNLARYVAAGRVAIPTAGRDDPNRAVYQDAAKRLAKAGLDVVTLPSPGLVERDGEMVPASYMNFVIGNATVVVPIYGAPLDEAAVDVVQAIFPDRRAIGLRADHLLIGGGSFHCISQQVPR